MLVDVLCCYGLFKCVDVLSMLIVLLARLILSQGRWPSCWKVHWLYPLYQRKEKSIAANYRGIHLTAQLSKVAERLLGLHLTTYPEASGAYGEYQFA